MESKLITLSINVYTRNWGQNLYFSTLKSRFSFPIEPFHFENMIKTLTSRTADATFPFYTSKLPADRHHGRSSQDLRADHRGFSCKR